MLSILVAKSKNNVIGKDNNMLWHISDDMKRFKTLTSGHTIIMGRKTFESLGKVLPNRKHVIFSRNPNFNIENENVEIVNSIEQIKKYIDSDEEVFVIGGEMIFDLLMPYVKILYVTELDKNYEGDTFFSKIDSNIWKEISRQQGPEDQENDFKYDYVVYKRIEK